MMMAPKQTWRLRIVSVLFTAMASGLKLPKHGGPCVLPTHGRHCIKTPKPSSKPAKDASRRLSSSCCAFQEAQWLNVEKAGRHTTEAHNEFFLRLAVQLKCAHEYDRTSRGIIAAVHLERWGTVLYVCMYVCMYVCTYVCILYVCMYVCIRIRICIYVGMYVCMYVRTYACRNICM